MDVKDITLSWGKMLLNTSLSDQEKERVKLCMECPKIRITSILGHDINSCRSCGCLILAKIRSEKQSCPLKKW